ncbi:universal stress protein [Halopenitus sp. POP-27]|uniref:universal stress protein n=1 Tax=Halopenitus sp. POP-27 TaxID=2994425 RepID=UPI0024691C74|nr:universal stress protein [Halopenitus sp. POP-27]
MTTFLCPTNSVHASAASCDYLADRVDADDTVHAVNSLLGGDDTSATDVRDGEEALNVVAVRLAAATVETHQFVRGNDPAEDVRAAAESFGADEIVISLRDRSPVEEALFGSVARRILADADRPVVAVPRE